jgi:CheY-like chemotaxis protein
VSGQATGRTSGPAPGVRARRVLLVEDSALVVEALSILLDASGYRVASAGSVADAVAEACAEPVDALLLDLTLPDGDGLAVLARLADAGALPHAAIALTGHDDAATVARCRAAGCVAVLAKPVASAALLRTLDEALGA